MKKTTSPVSRRSFLKTTAGLAAAAVVPQFIPGNAMGKDLAVAPSERITMGGLGLGSRGRYDLNCLLVEPDVQFVADCDLQKNRREAVKAQVDKHYGNKDCVLYSDMFDIYARDDIDALLIATGDRWHTMASVLAAKAGKDVYSEKPCSTTIAESQALANTMRRYGRVYQAGTQRRNIPNFQLAIDLVHSGKLGKLKRVIANTLAPGTTQAWLPGQPEPAKEICDWDRWLGPCPWRPYNSEYVNSRWRGYFDFHGGGILEWGSHTVDQCQWANQADDTGPVEFTPVGNHIHSKYANGVELIMRDTGWLGLGTCSVRYEGEEGWVETGDSGRMEVGPDSLRGEIQNFPVAGTAPQAHLREFLNCVKTRGVTKANGDVAGRSHIVCHAAYICWQLGRKVQWDPVKEEFLGDEEANRMRTRAMREPWRI